MFFTLSREILKYFSQAAQSTYRSKLPLIFRTFPLPSIPQAFSRPNALSFVVLCFSLWSLSERDAKVLLFSTKSSMSNKKNTKYSAMTSYSIIYPAKILSPQQRSIPVTQETIARFQRKPINFAPISTHKCRNQHQ